MGYLNYLRGIPPVLGFGFVHTRSVQKRKKDRRSPNGTTGRAGRGAMHAVSWCPFLVRTINSQSEASITGTSAGASREDDMWYVEVLSPPECFNSSASTYSCFLLHYNVPC